MEVRVSISLFHMRQQPVPTLLDTEQLLRTHTYRQRLVIRLTTGEHLQHCFYMHLSYLA